MSERAQQLQRRIESYRERLRIGVPIEEARQLLTLILELETEVVRLISGIGSD